MRDSLGNALAREVDARLREHTDPERRAFTQGYFPSALENLGVAVPHVRKVARDLKRRLKGEDGEVVLDVARGILTDGTLEGRNLAYFVVHDHPGAMARLDLRTLEELGRGMDNWTSVDTFACYVAGPAWREGRIQDASVRKWARSKDRWWRRAALVSTVALNLPSRGGTGDTPRTLATCALLADDHDDMVVKGMSWALRTLGAVDPEAARGFLREHAATLHERVVREVENKLETGRKTPAGGRLRRKA